MLPIENNDILQSLAVNSLLGGTYYYCKNRDAKYLSCNDQVAHALSLASIKDITHLTDHDFGWDTNRIKKLHDIDKAVIENAQTISHLEEPFILPNGKKIQLLSHKTPLRDKKSNIIGIVGISIDVTEKNITHSTLDPIHSLHETLNQSHAPITKREAECLHYLMKGKTARETAALLFLSPRTVELYLSTLKEKFNCRKKSELLDFVWKLIS